MIITHLTGEHQVAAYDVQLAHGKFLRLDQPQVMGIINLAPDSFVAKSRCLDLNQAVDYACQLVEEGAAIIDIGAEPTNPSLSAKLSENQELDRLLPILEQVTKYVRVPISIDTSNPKVMVASIKMGAHLINDVRALRLPGALETAATLNAGICLMHMRYLDHVPNIPQDTNHCTLLGEITSFLKNRIAACLDQGIQLQQLVIDPGIGYGSFGKTTAQNCQILQNLGVFQDLGCPLLIGASRKTFIGDILQVREELRVSGSIAAAVVAALQGAHLIRVHDVKETVAAIKTARAIIEEGK